MNRHWWVGFFLIASLGRQALAIVGGVNVDAGDAVAATTVQVYTVNSLRESVGTCTGNIIGDHVLLTAAHCVPGPGEQNYVYFSNQVPDDILKFFFPSPPNNDPALRKVVGVTTASPWGLYQLKPEKNWRDLAVMKFEGELPPGFHRVYAADEEISPSEPVLIAGFGMTDGFKTTSATVLQKARVASFDSQWSETEILLDTTQGRASCHGDSGGPAFVIRNRRLILVAIDSRSELRSDPNHVCTGYSIYTRIAPFQKWIRQQIRRLN